jgi:hypothetical protein
LASPAAWAQEARQAAGERLTSLPSLTGQEEVWRFTPPADLGLEGPEPEAPGAVSSVAVEGGVRAARLRLLDGAPSAPELVEVADGVVIAELGAALEEHESLIRDRLYGLVAADAGPRRGRHGPGEHVPLQFARGDRRTRARPGQRPGRLEVERRTLWAASTTSIRT